MWTYARSSVTVSASSKSFAVSGSIVNVQLLAEVDAARRS